MTLCSADSSKLGTISSTHIWVCMIKHLSEIVLSTMRYILSRMLISLHRLAKFLFFKGLRACVNDSVYPWKSKFEFCSKKYFYTPYIKLLNFSVSLVTCHLINWKLQYERSKVIYSRNIGLLFKNISPSMLSNISSDFISDMGVTDHRHYDR